MVGRIVALLSTLAMFACTAVGVRDAEEPKFTVTAKLGEVEIRQYGPRVAADTVVPGDEQDARDAGFRRLAAYISGANQGNAKIAMTAPEAQQRDARANWRIRFVMPANDTLATLPKPTDPQVALAAVPPETMAVLRFTGSTAPDTIATRTGELVAALEHSAWRPAGAPVAWFYNPPWTAPSLRRNEVAIPVSPN